MALFGGRKPPKAIIAAATRLRIGERSTPKPKPQDWQRRAWDFYDSVGEVEDAHRQFAGLVSRVRFFPAFQTSPDAPPSSLRDVLEGENPPPGLTESYVDFVEELHRRITSPQGGPSAIQREMTTQLSVPGESFLVGREVEGGDEQFGVFSGDELVYRGQRQWELRADPGTLKGESLNPDTTLIIRVWQQHPRFSAVATSPMRAILDDLDELLLLAQGNRAVAQSRIANAGILFMSKDLGFGPADPTHESEGHDSEQDPFFARLAESMLTAIKDPGAASAVVPIVVRADGVAEGKMEHLTLDRPLDEQTLARMDALVKRIAYGLPLPLEQIMGLSDLNHWCVDDQTEILTADGWRHHDQIAPGTVVLTLDHEVGASTWQPVDDIYRAEVTDEPMLRFDGMAHSSLTTLHHRWPVIREREAAGQSSTVREIRLSGELTAADRIVTAAPCVDVPTEPKWSDALVEAVAWFWTEGSVSHGSHVTVAQSHTRHPERVARIRRCLTELYGASLPSLRRSVGPAWRESVQSNRSSFGGPVTIFHLNKVASAALLHAAPAKRVAPWFVQSLTAGQLALFCDVSEMGDGQHYRGGRHDIWQAAPGSLDAYELALILSGRMVSRTDNGRRVNAWNRGTARPVKAAVAGGSAREVAPYSGTIWCPVTANQTWLARRDGKVFYTGNTAWQVSEQTFNVYVEPMVLLIADALTSGWLRPGLEAANFPPELVRRTLVWYDPSAIVTHPNRAEDFRQGHRDFVISDDSYRREIGATDEDAPDADEIDQRIQIASATRSRDGIGAPPASPETTTPGPPAAIGPGSPAATPTRPAERPALTAATPAAETPRQSALAALGPRLAEIDRSLLERLLERSDRAVSDAVRQAGARLRSKAQGNTEARRMLQGVPAEQVAATLGPGMIVRLQLDQEQLLAGTLDPVRATFDSQVGRAQRAALDALEPLDAETRERIEAEQDDDRNEGWLLLLAGLAALASERMFNPAQEIPELGEFDDSIDVPASLVRRALARAGGAQGIEATAAGGLLTAGGVRPVGGVATGPLIERAAKESLQAVFVGWEWLYGDPSTRKQPYEPHRALNHVKFDSWQDPILANTAGVWPGVAYFHPGDHFWCRCSFEPTVADDESADEGTVQPPSDEPSNTED